MELPVADSRLWERWNAYQTEVEAIKRKIGNGVPEGKRGKLEYRLNDLETRLLPQLVKEMQAS
jgi:hypothetical protein